MKSDKYRTFLHDLKQAWIAFSDGPINNVIVRIRSIITGSLNGGTHPDAIFVMIREPEELEKTRAIIANDLQLLCLTILVKGIGDPKDFTNDSDRNVYDFDYDLIITNTEGNLGMLGVQAALFAKVLHDSNIAYGIPVDSMEMPDERLGNNTIIGQSPAEIGDPFAAVAQVSSDPVGSGAAKHDDAIDALCSAISAVPKHQFGRP